MAIASLKEFEKKTKDYLNELKEEVKRFERVVNNTNDKLRWEGASYILDSISKSAEDVAKAMRDFQNNLKMGKVEESVKPIRKSFKQYLTEAVLPTENEAWGFFGTGNAHNDYEQTKVFWDYASKELAKKLLWSPKEVREFLDSRGGRHFADSVTDLGPWSFRHIDKAIQDWQSKDWFNSYK